MPYIAVSYRNKNNAATGNGICRSVKQHVELKQLCMAYYKKIHNSNALDWESHNIQTQRINLNTNPLLIYHSKHLSHEETAPSAEP